MSKKSKLLAFSSMLSLLAAALLVSINTEGQELETGGTLRSAAQTHGFLVGASAELPPLETIRLTRKPWPLAYARFTSVQKRPLGEEGGRLQC